MDPSRAYSGVYLKKSAVKLQKIHEIHPTLPLTEFGFLQKYRESFVAGELGRIYAQLPLKDQQREPPLLHRKGHYHKFCTQGAQT